MSNPGRGLPPGAPEVHRALGGSQQTGRHGDSLVSSVVSVVTLLLLPQAQGDVWLFEDSLLITGKPAGTSAA